MSSLFSLPFILALAFVTLMLVVAWFLEQQKKHHKQHIASAMYASDNNAESVEALRALLLEHNQTSNHRIKMREGVYCVSHIGYRLWEIFGKNLVCLQEMCNIPQQNGELATCSRTYGIKANKSTILLQLGEYPMTMKDNKGRLLYSSKTLDLEDYIEGQNQFKGSYSVKVATSDEYSEEDYKLIVGVLDEAQLTSVSYPSDEKEHSIGYYSLEKEGNEFYLNKSYRKIRPMSAKLLNASYSKAKISFEGEEVEVPMAKGMEAIMACIENKENISIFGDARTGKSYLIDEVARRAAKNGNLAVIFISPVMVEKMQDPNLLPQLTREIKRLRDDEGETPLFIIDEAEHLLKLTDDGVHSITNSFMLSMMDGVQSKDLNCNFAMTFNCHKDNLNPKAFMEGRMGLEIELGELPQSQADEQLVPLLKEINPMLVFDSKRWEMLRKKDTVLLASVYGCFVPPTKQRIIGNIVKEMRGEPITDRVVKPSTPNIPKATLVPAPSVASMIKEVRDQSAPIASPQSHHNGQSKNRRRGNKNWKPRDSRD